jgi:restriction system protein
MLLGIVSGDYEYVPNTELPHRRKVDWSNKVISKQDISQQLKNSMGSIGTVINITKCIAEVQSLLGDLNIIEKPTIVSTNPDVENASRLRFRRTSRNF